MLVPSCLKTKAEPAVVLIGGIIGDKTAPPLLPKENVPAKGTVVVPSPIVSVVVPVPPDIKAYVINICEPETNGLIVPVAVPVPETTVPHLFVGSSSVPIVWAKIVPVFTVPPVTTIEPPSSLVTVPAFTLATVFIVPCQSAAAPSAPTEIFTRGYQTEEISSAATSIAVPVFTLKLSAMFYLLLWCKSTCYCSCFWISQTWR